VAQVTYSDAAASDIERVFEFLAARDPYAAGAAVSAIRVAVDILAQHPLIGRAFDGPLRELVISFGNSGYVALYRYRPERNEVRILAIRHQRELDFPG
jgi:plasmid stabilization system protein ParE